MKFRSNGKLLISGEYLVLKGAKALAIPTRLGQSLEIQKNTSSYIWQTFVKDEKVFEGEFNNKGVLITESGEKFGKTIEVLFSEVANLKGSDFFKEKGPTTFISRIEFPLNWGLGSSSTLISNLAKWTGCDPFQMLFNTLGGSGFDVACANAKGPIIFQLNDGNPNWNDVDSPKWFEEKLFFVHLNRKMKSSKAVLEFNKKNQNPDERLINRVSEISESLIRCSDQNEFSKLIEEHENIVSDLLRSPTIKESEFSDFNGAIKSLGAWGGDFVMAIGNAADEDYFRKRGYHTILRYNEMFNSLQVH